jgi:hypothetical protein
MSSPDLYLAAKSSSSLINQFFHEGARVKSRVTPLIDNNKISHLLDEQRQQQQYTSVQQDKIIQRA